MITDILLNKSLVAYLDILGFSKRFQYENDSCIKLITEFAKYNGTFFIAPNGTTRQMRASSLCFSDSIGVSIPVNINPELHTDEYYLPIISFLHALSFLSFTALQEGVLWSNREKLAGFDFLLINTHI